MRYMTLSPAEYVVFCFGGVRSTARALNRSPSSVCLWRKPKSKRGRGGQIPTAMLPKILEKAKQRNIDITPEDLVLGRKISMKKAV